METKSSTGLWKPKFANDSWQIQDENGRIIASIENSRSEESYAYLIAASPYMLEALKGVAELIGDEDLPDNGELSGAAICDLVRSAVALSSIAIA